MDSDWTAVLLTLRLAATTSLMLMLVALPLAWWLAHWRHPLKNLVQSLIALPLVLPPTVLGFYLLVAFSPSHLPGQLWAGLFDSQLAFSFSGLVVGSMVYSLPFAVQPLYTAFVQLDYRYLEVSKTLGLSAFARFRRVVVPLCRPYFVVALGLTFAHTVGEFGVVLMIGGNIPGQTQVLSIALYDHVESLDYDRAHLLAFGLLVFSFVMLSLLYRFNRKGSAE
ncbi:molybdate ABC transporter permease subunit [Alteromonas aestuariivivens]|uniref:Molybdenum transport system permease n=1 Tax=Alteromonas aestuariivivens TaxID=1938339 RepID=A0A3D8M4E0_9ALTE|nr:molybdate ABC transporter permease subunit [Alteromonas aestuariivivens]RDV24478.1 molybdate ABC transporter permease subunit [Alteromonas aestuariivivens]